jgi:mannose/cellobiose epimerase-like protein (N-acyl-D-glucosamine 2-epimerase family)
LPALTTCFERWLMDRALPLWCDQGLDRRNGGFVDLIGQDGEAVIGPRRGRVQGRQTWVFALAGIMGWQGAWQDTVHHGLDFLLSKRNADGQISSLFAADGSVKDGTATLYDQTFVLLALSEAFRHFPERHDLREAADVSCRAILARSHPAGGFVESAPQTFQSNPHMHLLEATLAWRAIEPDAIWDRLADEIAEFALARLIDDRGAMREFYDAQWRPASGAPGSVIEPGHQFEWAWLMNRWAQRRGDVRGKEAARRLFEIGGKGVDVKRGAAIDELDDEFRAVRSSARLWPQTERLKAALGLMVSSQGAERDRYRADALQAANTLWRYLETPIPGLWRDKWQPDGAFVEEPAPASSLYHIICAIQAMKETVNG